MDRASALAYVRSLSEGDLAAFIREAALPLRSGDLREGLLIHALASVFHVEQAAGDDYPPVIRVAARPVEGPTAGDLDQSGTCKACGLEVTCNAKLAWCPVCDSRIECT